MTEDEALVAKIEELLLREVGPHGGFVMVVERYDEDLREFACILTDADSAPWKKAGLFKVGQLWSDCDLAAGFEE